LRRAIKQQALNYQDNKYEMAIILDAIKLLVNTRQQPDETLQAYTARFKTARDLCEANLGGPLILTKYVQQMDDYDEKDDQKVKACNKKAFKRFTAYAYLDNSDKAKYGSIIQRSLKNNEIYFKATPTMVCIIGHCRDHLPGSRGAGQLYYYVLTWKTDEKPMG
jgi:hypothetical protein